MSATSSTHMPRQPLQPGDKIGKFEVVEQIGAGGMSIVWKGYDRLLDRHVAIKQFAMPFEGPEGEDLRERFRREARLQKQLAQQSDHLVKIIDTLDNERGLFIIMAYVDGPSLERLLAENPGPMEPRRALGIVAATALALEAIHQQGMLHGDLKPSNILLPREGGLKLVDFGLASLMEDQETPSLGTVRYMAPERVTGGTVDGRSDLYALGLIAYEMLAGREGFNEAFRVVLRDQRNQALRWMKWHANERAKPPALDKLNPDVPPTLSELVARLMEKDPAQRVASGAELIDAIRRHFAGTGATSPAPGTPLDTAAPGKQARHGAPALAGFGNEAMGDSAPTAALPAVRRNRLPVILAVLLALLVSLGGGVWLYQQHQRDTVVAQQRQEALQAYRAAQDAYEAGDYAAAQAGFDELAQRWSAHDIGRRSRAYALLSVGQAHLQDRAYEPALEAFHQAQALDVLKASTVDALIRETNNRRAFADQLARIEQSVQGGQLGEAQTQLTEMGQHALTEDEQAQVAQYQQQVDHAQREARIALALQRAEAMVRGEQRDEAITFLDQESERWRDQRLSDAADELRRQKRLDGLMAKADAAQAMNDWPLAVDALQEALTLKEDDPELARRLTRLQARQAQQEGQAFENAGNLDRALAAYQRSLGLTVLPGVEQAKQRIEQARQRAELLTAGDQMMGRRDYEAAQERYRQARALGATAEVEAKLNEAMVRQLVEQGKTAIEQDALEEARTALGQALAIAGDDAQALGLMARLDQLSRYHQLLEEGDAHRQAGRYGNARLTYRQARDVMDTPEVQTRLADTEYEQLVHQARAFMAREQWTSAWAMLKAAAEVRQTEEIQALMEEVRPHLPPERRG